MKSPALTTYIRLTHCATLVWYEIWERKKLKILLDSIVYIDRNYLPSVGVPYHFKAIEQSDPGYIKANVILMSACMQVVCTDITNTQCCFVHHPRAVCQSSLKCCSAISNKYCSVILLFTADLITFSTETNLHIIKKCIY